MVWVCLILLPSLCPVRVLSPVGAINSHSHVQAAQEIIQQEQTQGETRLLQISLPSLCILHFVSDILLGLNV